MKKEFLVILVLGVIAAGFTSCRSGKDDPLISFRSRNTRLIGTWKLVSINNLTIAVTNNDTTNTSTTLKSSGYKEVKSVHKNTTTIDSSQYYAKSMVINSDGTYNVKETTGSSTIKKIKEDGGYWYWLTGDEDKIAIKIGTSEYRLSRLSYSDITMNQSIVKSASSNDNGTVIFSSSTTTTVEEKYTRQ